MKLLRQYTPVILAIALVSAIDLALGSTMTEITNKGTTYLEGSASKLALGVAYLILMVMSFVTSNMMKFGLGTLIMLFGSMIYKLISTSGITFAAF
jgi:hypothetical protein